MSAVATPTRPKAAIRKAVAPAKAVEVAEVDEYSPARIKAASAPVATEKAEHFAVTAWYRARESQEVIYACAENYGGPETLWALHTLMNVCVQTLAGLQDGVTESGCQDSSNLLSQSIALASLLSEDVDGNPWEILLDAGLSLMVLAKDVLDKGWEAHP